MSRTVEYAISAMAFLASQPTDELCEVRRIAAHTDVPLRFLSKILNTLRRGGLVQAARGTGGGYRLALSADQISLTSILQTLGEHPEKDRFARRLAGRKEEGTLRFHQEWSRLQREFLDLLETTSVADLAGALTASTITASARDRRAPS